MQHYIYKDGTCFIPSTTRTDGQIPLCQNYNNSDLIFVEESLS